MSRLFCGVGRGINFERLVVTYSSFEVSLWMFLELLLMRLVLEWPRSVRVREIFCWSISPRISGNFSGVFVGVCFAMIVGVGVMLVGV